MMKAYVVLGKKTSIAFVSSENKHVLKIWKPTKLLEKMTKLEGTLGKWWSSGEIVSLLDGWNANGQCLLNEWIFVSLTKM